MTIEPTTLLVAATGIFVIGFMKGAFGGGFAIIGIPLLALVMDPIAAGALLAPLFIAMDLFALRYWKPCDLVETGPLDPASGATGRHRDRLFRAAGISTAMRSRS